MILPNKNNAPVLDLFFETLVRNTDVSDVEFVVADDGSTDSSVSILRRWRDSGPFKRFVLLETPGSGVCDALNLAIEHATGEVIVRLDGDATLETPGWLETMLDFHESHPKVGVVAGKVVFESGVVHSYGMNVVSPAGVHSRGTFPTEPPGQRTLDTWVKYPLEPEAVGFDTPAEVDGVIGCCMVFERELWERVGGFDPRWNPWGFEDFDFAMMARREGLKVFVLPEVLVIHRISLRNPREDVSRTVMALFVLRRRFGRFVPAWIRARAAARAQLGDHDPARHAVLYRHYDYWREKWGWDVLNPDMDEIRARYAGTEVWWSQDEDMRDEGEEILRAFERRRAEVAD
jgi:GT2 family glycosyltransferase